MWVLMECDTSITVMFTVAIRNVIWQELYTVWSWTAHQNDVRESQTSHILCKAIYDFPCRKVGVVRKYRVFHIPRHGFRGMDYRPAARDFWFGFNDICAFTIVTEMFVLLRVLELVIVVLWKCFCVSISFCHQIRSWFDIWTDSLVVV